MKKFLTITALLSFTCLHSFSQNVFRGKITDNASNEPIGRVVIALVYEGESTAFKTEFSDAQGNFSISDNFKKDFVLKTQMMGYKPFEKKISINKIPAFLKIEIKSTQNKIKEVEIEGTRARVTMNGDTVVYDAKAFKTHKDATVEDLVKKMPGITTEGGTLKANGEEVKKITVDGQDFFGEDANIALRNLPAETVDKVEVFDGLSDRSSFTGFDDGNTTKTINLKTKANRKHGFFGKAYAGYGTENTYQAGGNLNYFDGSKRVSIIGMANNVNNLNFSTSEIMGAVSGSNSMGGSQGRSMMRNMSFGMRVAGGSGGGMGGPMSNFTVSNQNGVNKAYSFGVNYNDLWGPKTRFSSSFFTNRTDNFTNNIRQTQNFINNNSNSALFQNSDELANSTMFSNKFTTRLEGILDKNNSYIWSNKLNLTDNNSSSDRIQTNSFAETIASTTAQFTESKSKSTSFTSNFLYKLKFERKGRTFSFNPVIDITQQDGNSLQQTAIKNASGSTSFYELKNLNKQWTTTISGVLSYTEPSGKYGQWLLNYSPSISFKKNDVYNYVSTTQGVEGTLDNTLSSIYKNPIFYNTGGVSYRLQFTKWRFMFGTNVQNIFFKGDQQFPQVSLLEKNFFGVLPYFNIQLNPTKMFKIKLQYNTSLNVPSVSNIQPVLDISNPNSLYNGNKDLAAEYNHNLFFHFIKPNIVKGNFLFFMTNMSLTQNKISTFNYTATSDTVLDGVNLRKGVQYTKSINMDGNFNGMVFGNYTTPLKMIKSNFSFNTSVAYNRTPSMINNVENVTNSYTFSSGAMISSNVSENVDFSLGYNPRFNINNYSYLSSNNNNFWIQSLTSNLKVTFMKNFVLNSDFSYNYNNQVDPTLNQHVFLLGASIGYKMLKNRDLEIKVSGFDLFNQNRNITRTVSENSITDTRVNAMNRYFMLTATYNFKKFKSGGNVDEPNPMFKMMSH
jgi:hypothetical protein